ncbi:MAG: hypothetical protein Q4B70_11300 [Lachnospiraceae bacterium]|nr:hypothetical protein [Lachnospiraceae bacterium]
MITGFDGKPIEIEKKGFFYPVSMELCEEDNQNYLHINVRSYFASALTDGKEQIDRWKECIFDGFSDWAGEYTVFGGQQLTVTVKAEESSSPSVDTVPILCLSEEKAKEFILQYTNREQHADIEKALLAQRSFSTTMIEGVVSWNSILPRYIVLMPTAFESEHILRRTSRHEFGHILGLGDSYKDSSLGYKGVGMYHDILPYYDKKKGFDMVMDNCGPVRNNDIEMVILAFFTNRFQNYQSFQNAMAVSHALGRGN